MIIAPYLSPAGRTVSWSLLLLPRNTPQPTTGFAEIVSDDFPVLHAEGFWLFCSPQRNDKLI
jgi:hypothetical protein